MARALYTVALWFVPRFVWSWWWGFQWGPDWVEPPIPFGLAPYVLALAMGKRWGQFGRVA